MGSGAAEEKAISVVATATLVLGLLFCGPALADCSQSANAASSVDGAVGGHSMSLHSVSLRTALQGTVSTPGSASSQASCRRSAGTLVSVASVLPRSYVARHLIDGYSLSAASGPVAREMRIEVDPRIANSAQAESAAATGTSSEHESGLEARFGVRWQTMPRPAWVQRVPAWLVEDAKTYHRRGLPLLHLWESSNYLVALGLSNHGVPGVYFSQKLP